MGRKVPGPLCATEQTFTRGKTNEDQWLQVLGPLPHLLIQATRLTGRDALSLLAVMQLPCQAICPPAQGFASIVTN